MSKFFRLKTDTTIALPEAFRGHASWIGLLLLNLIIIISLRNEVISPQISNWAPQLALNFYLLVVYIYGQLKIKPVERYDFMRLITHMLLFGIIAACTSFFVEAVSYLFSSSAFTQKSGFINAVYLLSLLLISTYLVLLLIACKRLILYEKSRILLIAWRVFEYSLLSSMILGIFDIRMHTVIYNIILLGLIGMGVLLSVNLKWVGYLDFNQKWRSLLMLLGIVACLSYFAFFVFVYGSDATIFLNIVDNIFVLALLAFCLFYCLLSCLVIFFNLPTSSVYEKKLQEIMGFHKLNRTVQNDESELRLLCTLLENAISGVDAEIGWIELSKPGGGAEVKLIGELTQDQLNSIISSIRRPSIQKVFKVGFDNPEGREYYVGGLSHSLYHSMLVIPLTIKEEHRGVLVLLRDVEGGFNKDAVELAKTYADHTCVSIENMRLLKEAFQSERYKEELAIARRVQRSLLPEELIHHDSFELAVYSESADEVGGDYYDTYQLNEHQYALIIADVAGHGTSAAFTMSQLKGVFHSLVPLGLSSRDFVARANQALSKCLDRATFITLTYMILNTKKKQIEFLRAGHCPTLYFRQETKEFLEFQNKGMGIGILRNNDYGQHLQENFVWYEPGDIMVLYTDGVIECKDEQQEEFGQERLTKIIAENAHENVVEIQKAINREVRKHTQKEAIEDDFTTLIIKFS